MTSLLRAISLSGADGVGKTSCAHGVARELTKRGYKCRYVWLRWGRAFSVPLLAYARLVGLTRYDSQDNSSFGMHEFHKSRFLSRIYPWTQYVDIRLSSSVKGFLSTLEKKVIIYDRFIPDMMVDLMIWTKRYDLPSGNLGKRVRTLIGDHTRAFILDGAKPEVVKCRPELRYDKMYDLRRRLYTEIAKEFRIPLLKRKQKVRDTVSEVLRLLGLPNKDDAITYEGLLDTERAIR